MAGNICRAYRRVTTTTMQRPLQTFLQFSTRRKLLTIRALLVILAIRLALRLVSLARIQRFVDTPPPLRPEQDPTVVADIIGAVNTVDRRFFTSTCLVNGLASQYLLTRHGFGATLQIGVRKNRQQDLEAHAWVTVDGRILIGDRQDLDSYTPLPGMEKRPR